MKISAYTTTLNCFKNDYPFQQSIRVMLDVFDEVCVADGGSTDDTHGVLLDMASHNPRLKVQSFPVDLSQPRWAIESDGRLKTKARQMCTGDVLWQIDNDQFIAPSSKRSVQSISKFCLENNCIMALEQVEFWGDETICRDDLTPKPMVSPANVGLIHDINAGAIKKDGNNEEYCKPYMSDSCDLVGGNTRLHLLPIFRSPLAPKVYHVSWLDLHRKVSHYVKLWPDFHKSMYNLDHTHNAMFPIPLDQVVEKDIDNEYKSTWQGKTRELTRAELSQYQEIKNYELSHKQHNT